MVLLHCISFKIPSPTLKHEHCTAVNQGQEMWTDEMGTEDCEDKDLQESHAHCEIGRSGRLGKCTGHVMRRSAMSVSANILPDVSLHMRGICISTSLSTRTHPCVTMRRRESGDWLNRPCFSTRFSRRGILGHQIHALGLGP